jgi:hypothetical protein
VLQSGDPWSYEGVALKSCDQLDYGFRECIEEHHRKKFSEKKHTAGFILSCSACALDRDAKYCLRMQQESRASFSRASFHAPCWASKLVV